MSHEIRIAMGDLSGALSFGGGGGGGGGGTSRDGVRKAGGGGFPPGTGRGTPGNGYRTAGSLVGAYGGPTGAIVGYGVGSFLDRASAQDPRVAAAGTMPDLNRASQGLFGGRTR